jgi:hypothetical protein
MGAGQPLYLKNNIHWHGLAGFGWICSLANPGLGAVMALVDEILAEGGGQPEIAAKKRKKRKRDSLTPAFSQRERGKSFAPFALLRGYFMVCHRPGPAWRWGARGDLAWAGPRTSARDPTMGA